MGTYDDLDEETRNMIQQAKRRMAATHSLSVDEDPREVMKQHNQSLHDAVNEIEAAMPKEKPSMKRQKIIEVSETLPTVEEIDAKHNNMDGNAVEQNAVQQPPKATRKGMVKQSVANPVEEPVVEEPVAKVNEPVAKVEPAPVAEKQAKPEMVSQFIPDAKYERGTVAQTYDSFVEITGLPSRGKFYANKIYGQAFKLIDMMLLADVDADNVYEIFDEILARRVKGIDPGNILSCDEIYILQWLRAASFPTQGIPHIGFKCEKCGLDMTGEDYQITFKNMQFGVGGNYDEVVAKHKNGFYEFHLDDGREVNLYLRRRVHDSIINKYVQDYRERTGKEPKGGLVTIINTAAIVEIEGCETMEDKVNLLCDLPYSTAKKMYAEIESSVLASETNIEHICPKCKGVVVTPYPFRIAEYISNL